MSIVQIILQCKDVYSYFEHSNEISCRNMYLQLFGVTDGMVHFVLKSWCEGGKNISMLSVEEFSHMYIYTQEMVHREVSLTFNCVLRWRR